jgi:hypothetical protein
VSFRLTWRGPLVVETIAARAVRGLDRIDLRIEARAKAELYPGHGKRTGVLQRSIQAMPVQRRGMRLVGSVGTRGVRYALRIHARYRYIVVGLNSVRGAAPGMLASAVRG